MGWNKPKNIWHWLALVSPGAASVGFTAAEYFLNGRAGGLALLGFPVAILMCIALAGRMAWGAETPGKKIGLGCLFTLLLLVVNLSIAFGGCALINIPFDMK